MEIKVITEKEVKDYTFVDRGLTLENLAEKVGTITHRGNVQRDVMLRDVSRVKKLKKSAINAGVQNMKGHSAAVE